MNSKTISISPRGQITLPKKLRDLFKTNSIRLEIIDDYHAMISPIPDVGGTISDRFFMEEWWYGHYDVAAGDGFALAGAGQNRRATVRQGF